LSAALLACSAYLRTYETHALKEAVGPRLFVCSAAGEGALHVLQQQPEEGKQRNKGKRKRTYASA
jgi:hypothetical protein